MKKGVLFKTVRVLLVLAASLAIAKVLWVLRPEAERQELADNGRLVEVFAARAQTLVMTVEAYGTVQPRESLDLVAEVKGRVAALGASFVEGAAVNQGDLLIAIDPRTYELEVQAREVALRQVAAELRRIDQEIANLKASRRLAASEAALAENEFNRLKTLSNRKVVAETSRDQAEQQYLASLERLQTIDNQLALTGPTRTRLLAEKDMAEVRRQQSALDLEHSRITAPFDGWVLEKAVEAGQYTTAGQHLGRIYRAGALDVEVRIPSQDLQWLPAGFPGEVTPEVVVSAADAAAGRTWKGRVVRAKARMESKTRTLPVVVEIEDPLPAGSPSDGVQPGERLRPGMFVDVSIRGRHFDEVFALPRHVVREEETVYIAENGHLRIRPVEVLRRHKDMVYVRRGLAQGDRVITTPLSDATDGMNIRVKDGDPEG